MTRSTAIQRSRIVMFGWRAGAGEERLVDRPAGRVGGVGDAPDGVAAFARQVKAQRPVGVRRERHSLLDQPLDRLAAVLGDEARHVLVDQAGPGLLGVADVEIDAVVVAQHAHDAALGPRGGRLVEAALGEEDDRVPIGEMQGDGQAGDAGTDDDDGGRGGGRGAHRRILRAAHAGRRPAPACSARHGSWGSQSNRLSSPKRWVSTLARLDGPPPGGPLAATRMPRLSTCHAGQPAKTDSTQEEFEAMRRLSLALLTGALAVGIIAAPAAAKQPDMSGSNIVDTAIAVNTDVKSPYFGQFDTLIKLVVDLELVDALSARGQLTVFAPTDTAFQRLFDKLTPEQEAALTPAILTDIVLYHVAKGERDAAEVLGSSKIRMLNGGFAMVDAAAVTIDGAKIEFVNVPASNGIIHVVSDVLLP